MGRLAFLFSGQGAQYVGMGKSLYSVNKQAAQVFDRVEAIRPGTKADCFEHSIERLSETDVTQPCVFTVDLAAAYALESSGISPAGVAGFSLGELAALTFAGCFSSLEEGFKLVRDRGKLMQKAVDENPGFMAAVMRLPEEKIDALCKEMGGVYPANYNSDKQIVVAGAKEKQEAFGALVKEAKGTMKPLAVAGAFHSPYMASAAEAFYARLQQAELRAPKIPVYANKTALPYAEPFDKTLADQIKEPVLWKKTLEQMWTDGFDTFIEVGPGKTLTGFVKRVLPQAKYYNVEDEKSLQECLDVQELRG